MHWPTIRANCFAFVDKQQPHAGMRLAGRQIWHRSCRFPIRRVYCHAPVSSATVWRSVSRNKTDADAVVMMTMMDAADDDRDDESVAPLERWVKPKKQFGTSCWSVLTASFKLTAERCNMPSRKQTTWVASIPLICYTAVRISRSSCGIEKESAAIGERKVLHKWPFKVVNITLDMQRDQCIVHQALETHHQSILL